MGVHGLWKLLEPSGKPVTLESLDNKVLAIDVSMWLHQVMKGYQDSTGNAIPNAHLLGLFHRICKLLFYRIKPVFVFDGGVPQLKQQTMASRRHQRSKAAKQAERNRLILLRNLAEQGVVRQALGGAVRSTGTSPVKKPSVFADFILDPLPLDEDESSDDESEGEEISHNGRQLNFDNFDPESADFKRLPAKERLEILTELQESRKQNSWARINEMPQESEDFSGFQLRRLLVRRSAHLGLEQVEKELGERHTLTLAQLEEIMVEKGSLGDTLANMSEDAGKRIVSDTTTRFLLLKNGQAKSVPETTNVEPIVTDITKHKDTAIEIDLDAEVEEDEDEFLQTKEENSELSQAEIFALIKESSKEHKSSKQFSEDPNLPSTSSAGCYKPVSPEKNIREDMDTKVCNNLPNKGPLSEELLKSIATLKVPEKSKGMRDIHLKLPQKENNSIGTNAASETDNPRNQTGLVNVEFSRSGASENNFIRGSCAAQAVSSAEPRFVSAKDSATKYLTFYMESDPEKIASRKMNKSPEVCREKAKSESIEISDKVNIAPTTAPIISDTHQKKEEPKLSTESSDTDGSFESVEELSGSESENETEINVTSTKINDGPVKIHADEAHKFFLKEQEMAEVTKPKDDTVAESEEKIKEIIEIDILEPEEIEEPAKNDVPEVKEKIEELVENDVSKLREKVDLAIVSEPKEKAEPSKNNIPTVTTEELVQREAQLVSEGRELASEAGRQERLAISINDQMCMEAQQLLRLFGLPWVVAPMEAEAQCAMLDLLSLTQGTITDDSDIWLFGGRTVYRNFFNQSRTVEMYSSEAIQRCFKLSRPQLVLLAMLVGSDYTSGLTGIGPVTALEILAAFPGSVMKQQSNELVVPLHKFKEWWKQREKLSPSSKLKKLATKLRDLNIHEGFPSEAVAEAYLKPAVDESREKFSWGQPDIPALIKFTKEKFGWNQQRCESILNPVIKRLQDKSVQNKLDAYFTVGPKESKVDEQLSTRVRAAVSQLGTNSDTEDDPEPLETPSSNQKPAATKTTRQRKPPQTKPSTLEAMRKALNKKPRKKPLSETLPVVKPNPNKPSTSKPSTSKPQNEFIPQREKDRENALQTKLKAIELFRKRKLDPTPRDVKSKRLVKDDHYLSESSSDDE